MKKISLFVLVLVSLISISSCRSMRNAIAMKDCDYSFNKIGKVSFMGLGNTDGANTGFTDMLSLPSKIANAAMNMSSSMPLKFTLYLNVKNPNSHRAAVNHLDYKLTLSDVTFASGATESAFAVDGGETAILELPIETDIRSIMDTEHRQAVIHIISNMLGFDVKEDAKLKIQIKPTVGFQKKVFQSPMYIPIVIEYGGRK